MTRYSPFARVDEAFDDYNASVASGIVAWLTLKGFATEGQLTPLLDGSYKGDLPPEALMARPTPNRTGLGDGSVWPDGVHLPRMDDAYWDLLGVAVSRLDRLDKLDNNLTNFYTVSELRARREKLLAGEYPRPPEVVKEALDAVNEVLRALPDKKNIDILKDERIGFLLTLHRRLEALAQDWTEESLRLQLEQAIKLLFLDRQKDYQRCAVILYRIASLTKRGEYLRGYKSAMNGSRYGFSGEGRDAVLSKGLNNTRGVRAQLPTPAVRDEWTAGYTQGIDDIFAVLADGEQP